MQCFINYTVFTYSYMGVLIRNGVDCPCCLSNGNVIPALCVLQHGANRFSCL